MEGQQCHSCAYVFRPLEDDLLDAQFTIPRASEISLSIRLFFDVDEVVSVFERAGDEHGQCDAHRLRAWLHWNEGQADAASEAWERAAAHARKAGDEHERTEILSWVASALWWGPTPVERAIRRCEEIRREVSANPAASAQVLQPVAALHAMKGGFDHARGLHAASGKAFEELGLTLSLAVSHTDAGTIDLLAGDPLAAERNLRRGYDALAEMGERNLLSTSAALLAQALLALQRDEEAERFARLSEESADADDLITQVLWRGVRARTLARRGLGQEAESMAREAVALAETSDFVNDRGDAFVDLAFVRRHAGQLDQARAALAEGLRCYEQKGNVVAAGRVRADLAVLDAV
jgi:tetratricopeptide (TPR) repeat protein